MLLLLSHFSCVRLCATPQTAAHKTPLSLGFSRPSGKPINDLLNHGDFDFCFVSPIDSILFIFLQSTSLDLPRSLPFSFLFQFYSFSFLFCFPDVRSLQFSLVRIFWKLLSHFIPLKMSLFSLHSGRLFHWVQQLWQTSCCLIR